jgi:hypothetical protein
MLMRVGVRAQFRSTLLRKTLRDKQSLSFHRVRR